jgi:DNA-binding response OmpR family regulator
VTNGGVCVSFLAKILYVDDEEELLMLVADYFDNYSIQVDTCLDINSAIQKIKDCHYDLIISDVRMPCGGGKKLFMALKDEKNFTGKFLFLTGDSHLLESLKEMKPDLVLLKPIDFSKMLSEVKNLLSIEF